MVVSISYDKLCVFPAFVGAQNYDLIPAARVYVQVCNNGLKYLDPIAFIAAICHR